MARSKKPRREQHRTEISGADADRRALIIMPVDSIESADAGQPVRWADMARFLERVGAYPAPLAAAPSSVALVLDDFAFDLHLGDRFLATGTHDGSAFRSLAVEHGAHVYLADRVDVRRAVPTDLAAAATSGHLVGGRVSAFGVEALDPR